MESQAIDSIVMTDCVASLYKWIECGLCSPSKHSMHRVDFVAYDLTERDALCGAPITDKGKQNEHIQDI
jgi:phosphatidylethanolamine-binding protein (PEBP) family uncharacterized protein